MVLYDQTTDHWILSQFTTRGFDDPTLPFFNCVAVSQTGKTAVKFNIPEAEAVNQLKDLICEHGKIIELAL